jgi:hypothetical protein
MQTNIAMVGNAPQRYSLRTSINGARTRRDGSVGVQPSGHDNWHVPVLAMNDASEEDQRDPCCGAMLASATRTCVWCLSLTQVPLSQAGGVLRMCA